MADVTITPRNNGPYHLKGSFTLVTQGGRELPFEGDQVWLCRCGHSSNKPFCDGTHKTLPFQSDLDTPLAALEGDYIEVAMAAEIGEGQIRGVQVGDRPVVVIKRKGILYALSGVCTHAEAMLEDGELEEKSIVCPLHGSAFDLVTGQPIQPPATEPLPTYDVRVLEGKVLVAVHPRPVSGS